MANSTYTVRRVDAATGQSSDTVVERTDADEAEHNERIQDMAFLRKTDAELQALSHAQFRRAALRIVKRIIERYLA